MLQDENIASKYERVYAQVDLDAIIQNMIHMKEHISKNTQIIGVIKTDGYGHGCVPIAKELEKLDFVFGFAVATYEEGHVLRMAGIKKPILILGYSFPHSYEKMIEEEIRPAVFSKECIEKLSDTAEKMGKKCKVHIKVDTGMGRIGVRPNQEGMDFVKTLLDCDGIELEGIFTHFSKADETDKTTTYEQLESFCGFVESVEKTYGIQIPYKHCSNSASIMEIPKANLDIVRAGITLYGLTPSDETNMDLVSLTPALSLYSRIVYCKWIDKGDTISYGGTFNAQKPTRVATIPVGYGDGYPRSLSNKGYVLIDGKKAPVLGKVCMDQFMVDVTDIPSAKEGDSVVLIGESRGEKITAEMLGKLSGRFNYELVCDLGKRIPRVYIKAGKVVECKDYFEDYL